MNHISPSGGKHLDIAVIGGGIAGMSAAWLLSKGNTVMVYEEEDRLGGHSNTVEVAGEDGPQPVDTGFIVYNDVNYPNLVALFDHLDVPTEPSDMSFSVSLDGGSFEYGSRSLNAILGQRSNIASPRFWGMLSDIWRFFKDSEAFLSNGAGNHEETLGGFLYRNSYGPDFVNRFILPMGAAIWSTRPDEMREQPALTFIRFFVSHGLLQFTDRTPWRTVTGGSREYVQRLTAAYAHRVHLGRGVKAVSRHTEGVDITDISGQRRHHDAVIIAAHADQALAMLSDADDRERSLLGAFRYTDNRVILHSDTGLMPARRKVWSSWNYMGDAKEGVSVTYWMNLLQSINHQNPLFVSVNPKLEPNPSRVHRTFGYQHPYYDLAAWKAQKRLWDLQGRRNTWFCGSYFGYGFHEDALQAGLAVAEELGGVRRPWAVENESGRICRTPGLQGVAA